MRLLTRYLNKYKRNVNEKMADVKKNENNIQHIIDKLKLAEDINNRAFEANLTENKDMDAKPDKSAETKNQIIVGKLYIFKRM